MVALADKIAVAYTVSVCTEPDKPTCPIMATAGTLFMCSCHEMSGMLKAQLLALPFEDFPNIIIYLSCFCHLTNVSTFPLILGLVWFPTSPEGNISC